MTGKIHWAHRLGDQTSPGPGSYNIPSCFGKTSPRYSIKKRYPERKSESSPDFYDVKMQNTSPSYTIRPKTADTRENNDNPGPSYVPPPMGTPSFRKNKPKPIEKRERKYESYNTSIQGPAEFNTSPRNKKYAYIGKRTNDSSWLSENDNPSPDQYDPKMDLIRPQSPRYSLRASPKVPVHEYGPGPGGISIPSNFGKKAAAIHIRHKEYGPPDTPGPGTYEISGVAGKNARSATISPRYKKRDEIDDAELVQLPSIFSMTPRITIGERMQSTIPKTPGPGDYETTSCLSPRGYVMQPKQTQKQIEEMEELKRRLPYNAEEPGPGTYKPKYEKVLPGSPRFSFGDKGDYQTAVPTKDNGIPGPEYNVEKQSDGPKFTIKGRNFMKEAESETLEADYNGFLEPPRGHSFTIGRRDEIELIPD